MPDDVSVGRQIREVRLSKNLTQEGIASRSGLSRQTVSRLERGLADGLTVGSLRRLSRALEMPPVVGLGWRAPELDRLRDRAHARLVELVASTLGDLGWEILAEYSFNYFGERGSADILGWHPAGRTLLVAEVKTRLWDLQDTLTALDRKRRIIPGLAARELGWPVEHVGVVLAMAELSSHRHMIQRHAATFRAALPDRQLAVKDWLADPSRDLRGIWFLPNSHHGNIEHRPARRRATGRPSSQK